VTPGRWNVSFCRQPPLVDEVLQVRLVDAHEAADLHDPDEVAGLVARAGAREALALATGNAVFSSIADLRSFRIFCLLQEGMSLADAERLVGALFKVPPATAKRMVNAAVARYAIDLRDSLEENIVSLLEGAVWREGRWEMRMPSTFVRERVWDVVDRLDVPNPTQTERGALWKLADETYQSLREEFALQQREPPS
jgi:hypothetical protein